MTQVLTISIVIGVLTNGIQGLIGYFRYKKVKTLQKDLLDERIKLDKEIKRSQEKQQQVEDLLNFNSNDAKIQSKMDESIKILTDTRSKTNVKKELSNISTNVRNIFNSK